MKRIIITLLTLASLGGVASADRGHRGGGPVVRDHRPWNAPVRTWGGSGRTYTQGRTYSRPTYNRGYVYSRPSWSGVRVTRHPIFVRRPEIRYHYYNYYQRPSVIVENYPSMPGYIWVAGQWQWSGYEWIWQPGHYEPDASYQGD